MTRFERIAPAGCELPALRMPSRSGETLAEAAPRLRAEIDTLLATVGGVLLRGFQVPSVEAFRATRCSATSSAPRRAARSAAASTPPPSTRPTSTSRCTTSRPTPASGR